MSLKYAQREGRCKTSFDFGDEELTYTFDAGTKAGSAVAYHKIPHRSGFREVRLWWLKYFVLFYLTFCSIITLYYTGMSDIADMYITLYFATLAFLIFCLIGLRRRMPGMTSFAIHPPLVILHNRQRQTIMSEIMKRRQAAMKVKLGQVDTAHPYYEEASKFSWLREEGVISEQEYREARKKIAAMRDKTGLAPHGAGKVN